MKPADGVPVGLRHRRSLGGAAGSLNRWNARHPWSHNDHFHGWILRHLPRRRTSALDVGCGRGGLVARLAGEFASVAGIDPDAEMVAASRHRLAGRPHVTIGQESLLETTGRFDLVTMVASLHHLPLEEALRHAAGLLAPGGRLLVVGLAQVGSRWDVAYDSASLLLNPLVGLVKHPRAERGGPQPPDLPVRDPAESYAETRAVVQRLLPGARMRHRLFFRYTMAWDRGALQS